MLEPGSMFVVAYKAQLHDLCCYYLQLITLEYEQIRYFIEGLNLGIEFATLSVSISGKSFQDIGEFSMKGDALEK